MIIKIFFYINSLNNLNYLILNPTKIFILICFKVLIIHLQKVYQQIIIKSWSLIQILLIFMMIEKSHNQFILFILKNLTQKYKKLYFRQTLIMFIFSIQTQIIFTHITLILIKLSQKKILNLISKILFYLNKAMKLLHWQIKINMKICLIIKYIYSITKMEDH